MLCARKRCRTLCVKYIFFFCQMGLGRNFIDSLYKSLKCFLGHFLIVNSTPNLLQRGVYVLYPQNSIRDQASANQLAIKILYLYIISSLRSLSVLLVNTFLMTRALSVAIAAVLISFLIQFSLLEPCHHGHCMVCKKETTPSVLA